MAFKDLPLWIKLGSGFGLVLVMTAVVAGVGLQGMASVDDRVDKAADVQRLVDLMNEARHEEKDFVLHDDDQAALRAKEKITALIDQAHVTRAKFKTPSNQAQMDRVTAQAKEYTQSLDTYLAAQGRRKEAEKVMLDAAHSVEKIAAGMRDEQLAEYRAQKGTDRAELDELVRNAVDSDGILGAILQARRREKDLQLRRDPKYAAMVMGSLAEGEKLAKAIRDRETTEGHRKLAADALAGFVAYRKAFDSFAAALEGRGTIEQALLTSARSLEAEARASAADQARKRDAEMARARSTMVAGLALAILAGVLAAFFATRRITTSLARAVEAADKIASGDLTVEIQVDSQDEIGRLLAALARMDKKLAEIVAKVRATSARIATASTEIAEGNEALARRTTEQVASLEETAASMEELTSTVKQNTESAGQADALAIEARHQAEHGSEVLQRAMSAMGELSASSTKIADIIGLIDEIAFQTNVLALNAAVEAARAGDQGRGFAVVAAEVRQLAQRSAAAAREISGLIRDSLSRVAEDTRLVNASGQSLHDILGAVTKVTDVVGRIAEASRAQTSGIEQASDAMAQIDSIAQRNSSLVESAASSARALDEQAHALEQLMSQFKVANRRSAAATSEPLTSLVPQPA